MRIPRTHGEQNARGERIVVLYESGLAEVQIARRLGMTPSGVRYHLNKAGHFRGGQRVHGNLMGDEVGGRSAQSTPRFIEHI